MNDYQFENRYVPAVISNKKYPSFFTFCIERPEFSTTFLPPSSGNHTVALQFGGTVTSTCKLPFVRFQEDLIRPDGESNSVCDQET